MEWAGGGEGRGVRAREVPSSLQETPSERPAAAQRELRGLGQEHGPLPPLVTRAWLYQ